MHVYARYHAIRTHKFKVFSKSEFSELVYPNLSHDCINMFLLALMIPHLRDLSNESCLLQCGLTTLETRRIRGDQIEVFKIVNGYEDVDRNMFFKLKEGSRTRGHKAALVMEQCRLDMRKYSFSQRVINEWNKLSNDCVNASSVNMFTNRIDRYLIRAGNTDEKIVGLSISQWLPCPLVIWNLLFEMAILLNVVFM